MHFSAANLLFLRWVIFFINLFCFSFSDGQMSEVSFMSEVSLICGTNRAPSNTSYITPFVSEMEVLSQLVTTHEWGQHSSNTTPPIHVLAQCYQDLSHTDCLLCYANSRTRIPRCLPAMSARMYLDGCFLRYDNYSFFNESTDPIRDTVNCSTPLGQIGGNGAARSEFQTNVGHLIDNLTASAVADGGYAVEEMNGIYGLAQCWRTLNRDECRTCLEKARTESRRCFPSREGRALNAGCYLRYSTENFYSRNSNKKSGISTGAIVAIALAAAALFTITLFVGFAVYLKYSKSKKERKSLGQISISLNRSGLNFKYETLEKATNFFDQSRKIGQGGAGSVFRGTLPDGKTVAVKILYFSTKQWVDEFFNEVNLISGIQHKNLVKLLGCSIEGPESLLVYEYVPNRSLDQFLFDKNKIHTLNWKQRLNIIIGTAEGLAYLHGGTEIRIIHRDIKSSNVLLDENFAPKIADFGLARHFGADKSHLSTGIAGTLGYMAPEYIVRGQLTEKADVFSFGVLVLEILCGRKNNVFVEDSGSLLQTVWKLYITGRQTEAMDSSLNNDFPIKEASMVLQLGLLCTQASAALRPSMDEVVRMLQTDEDQEIPSPTQPPFLNPRALDPNSSSRSYTTNSLILNALSKIEVSYTTTESSSI